MKMWRILNFLFGYDYIAWGNSCDNGIARVRVNEDGIVYYFRHKFTGVINKIDRPCNVFWLTCKSDKYFKQKERN